MKALEKYANALQRQLDAVDADATRAKQRTRKGVTDAMTRGLIGGAAFSGIVDGVQAAFGHKVPLRNIGISAAAIGAGSSAVAGGFAYNKKRKIDKRIDARAEIIKNYLRNRPQLPNDQAG